MRIPWHTVHARTRQTTLNAMALQQRQNAEQLFATLSGPSSCCMLFPYMLTFCCDRVSCISESLSTFGSDAPHTVRLTIKGAPFFPNCAFEDAFGAFKRIWHVKVGQTNEFAGLSTFGPFSYGLHLAWHWTVVPSCHWCITALWRQYISLLWPWAFVLYSFCW